jgi:hypothetical protein
MNTLMTKYIGAFAKAHGTEVEKVKKVLMYHAHAWGWDAQDSLVADLLDDQNITAADIVEFLENIYLVDGGNREFSCAIKAMKVCLQKAKMQDAKNIKDDVIVFENNEGDEGFDGSNYYVPGIQDFLKGQDIGH